jgi:hypothetical protein
MEEAMVNLVGIALGLLASLYILYNVFKKHFAIRLHWPALLAFGLIIGSALLLVLTPGLLSKLPGAYLATDYPGVVFLLLLSFAIVLGFVLRPWRHRFYQILN